VGIGPAWAGAFTADLGVGPAGEGVIPAEGGVTLTEGGVTVLGGGATVVVGGVILGRGGGVLTGGIVTFLSWCLSPTEGFFAGTAFFCLDAAGAFAVFAAAGAGLPVVFADLAVDFLLRAAGFVFFA